MKFILVSYDLLQCQYEQDMQFPYKMKKAILILFFLIQTFKIRCENSSEEMFSVSLLQWHVLHWPILRYPNIVNILNQHQVI